MIRRVPAPALLLALAPASLVLAHNLTFLATYGPAYEIALVQTGHDSRWTDAVLVVTALSLLLLGAGTWRLVRLRAAARSLEGPTRPGSVLDPRRFLAILLRLWVVLALLVVVLFAGQENLERVAAGAGPPGPFVLLSPEYGPAIPIIALVTLAAAAVGALFRWGHAVLLERIARARRRTRLARLAHVRRPASAVLPRDLLLGRAPAGRAPPALLPR